MNMSDSGDEIFITQSTYSGNIASGTVIDSVLDMEEDYATCSRFDLRTDLFSDISDFGSGDDEILVETTQKVEQKLAKERFGPTITEIGDDEILVETTQNCVEQKLAKERFGPVITEIGLKDLVNNTVPKNTQSKSKWAVNAFEAWRKNRGIGKFKKELLKMENKELDGALCFFLAEVRNQMGQEYQPKTLYEMIVAIQHYLRHNGKNVNFLDDPQFSNMKRVLDAKMKELSKKGLGINRKQADIITVQQENVLWDKGLLGTDTPQKLLDSLLYSVGLNFALRAGQEHRNLRTGPTSQLTLIDSDVEGRRYLQYKEDVSKTNCGGILHRKVEPKVTRGYENPTCPERCLVRMYEQYLSKRPVGGKSTAFYLRPKKNYTDAVWFDDVPVGIHTLQSTVGRLCKEAGFSGHFTNHSLRATAATRLYSAGVDEQLITEKTGHRSSAVRTYKRTSDNQQEEVSSILQAAKVPKTDPCVQTSETPSREFTLKCDGLALHFKF